MADQMTDEEMKAMLDAAVNEYDKAYIPGMGYRFFSKIYGKVIYVTGKDYELVGYLTDEDWNRWLNR